MTDLSIDPQRIYSRVQAAAVLGVSLSTLKRLLASGQLVYSQPEATRRILIRGTSIIRFLNVTEVSK